ncbi:exported hypothetical protein [Arthrobacter sp. 9V]|uniref:hypothetical protein n=1 Tax=Bacillati TaxID=1783272 RepID=UPI0012F2B2DD|nr:MULTISPECIES: hypothetical protein [Terrabacteria group]VXB16889.1 exported hypothetical protein [Arthrobacter sp. 9V]VXB95209.1 conserved exported hypothetical protein [Curtobacterium sp. 8I-2]
MRQHTTTNLVAVAIAATLAAVALTGCSPDTPQPTPTTNSTRSAGPQLLGQTPGVSGAIDVPTEITNDANKRASVTLQKCAATKTGWQASGKIKNTGKTTGSYFITVFFTDTHGTVVGWSQVRAEAASEKGELWKAAATFTAPSDTTCAIAGVS